MIWFPRVSFHSFSIDEVATLSIPDASEYINTTAEDIIIFWPWTGEAAIFKRLL